MSSEANEVSAVISEEFMKTLKMAVELTYDAYLMYGDDPQSIDWFENDILRQKGNDSPLLLYSNEIGDEIGEIKVLEIFHQPQRQAAEVVMATLKDIEYPLRLCVEMMHFAGLGASGKTEDMTASEIKDALRVFFTDEQIDESARILSGS